MTVQISRREQAKASRREAILDAACDLFREAGAGASAEHIARRAEVSTATLYNLVGARDELLGRLLSRLFAELGVHMRAFEADDPLRYAEEVVVFSVGQFCGDAALWRHVIHEISGSFAARVAPYVEFQPIDLMVGAMRRAAAAGRLLDAADADAAALQIYTSYCGAMFFWAGGGFTDADFLSQARSGLWTVVAALGAPAERERALAALKTCLGPRLRSHRPADAPADVV